MIEKNEIKVAFLAYTYGTNEIPVPQGKEYLVKLTNNELINAQGHYDEIKAHMTQAVPEVVLYYIIPVNRGILVMSRFTGIFRMFLLIPFSQTLLSFLVEIFRYDLIHFQYPS